MMNDLNLTPAEYAGYFADFGIRDFGLNLDYSVESIEIVDRMLQAYVGDFHLDDAADRVVAVGAGCYVGEILIRQKLADRWVEHRGSLPPRKTPQCPAWRGVVLQEKSEGA